MGESAHDPRRSHDVLHVGAGRTAGVLPRRVRLRGARRGRRLADLRRAGSDLGCHPAGDPPEGAPTGTPSISFYCDDIEATVREMSGRGAEFTGPVEDHGYGLVTHVKVPGGFAVQLYQPRYAKG